MIDQDEREFRDRMRKAEIRQWFNRDERNFWCTVVEQAISNDINPTEAIVMADKLSNAMRERFEHQRDSD